MEKEYIGWKDIIALAIAFFEILVPFFLVAMVGIWGLMFIFSKL